MDGLREIYGLLCSFLSEGLFKEFFLFALVDRFTLKGLILGWELWTSPRSHSRLRRHWIRFQGFIEEMGVTWPGTGGQALTWEQRRGAGEPEIWSSHECVLNRFSCVWLFAILWTIACQAPLSMGFSRPEYWSGLPYPPPGDLPNPGIEPVSLMSPTIIESPWHSLDARWPPRTGTDPASSAGCRAPGSLGGLCSDWVTQGGRTHPGLI